MEFFIYLENFFSLVFAKKVSQMKIDIGVCILLYTPHI